ncbi:MAG: endonuclease Q family protein, partial [Methanolinea sp.]|nr:endonuclease Q family protein [Methanolinea sp.]
DSRRVHHLILMEKFADFATLQAVLEPKACDLAVTGRPRVRLSGETIAREVHDLGGLVGPAHAFTPWTALYAAHDSVSGCYGGETIDFLELGLSADSSYGSAIPDLYGVPFLSNSDAHSPESFGREYTVLSARENTPGGVLDSISRGDVVQNAGFFPEEGKYNRTACSRCYRQYSREDADSLSWRCPDDGGRIKKGVLDRARELSLGEERPRPPYLHRIPLTQVLQRVLSVSSPRTGKVVTLYNRFLEQFGCEIRVLNEAPIGELALVHPGTAEAVDALRRERVRFCPGGGGRYGTFSFY